LIVWHELQWFLALNERKIPRSLSNLIFQPIERLIFCLLHLIILVVVLQEVYLFLSPILTGVVDVEPTFTETFDHIASTWLSFKSKTIQVQPMIVLCSQLLGSDEHSLTQAIHMFFPISFVLKLSSFNFESEEIQTTKVLTPLLRQS